MASRNKHQPIPFCTDGERGKKKGHRSRTSIFIALMSGRQLPSKAGKKGEEKIQVLPRPWCEDKVRGLRPESASFLAERGGVRFAFRWGSQGIAGFSNRRKSSTVPDGEKEKRRRKAILMSHSNATAILAPASKKNRVRLQKKKKRERKKIFVPPPGDLGSGQTRLMVFRKKKSR